MARRRRSGFAAPLVLIAATGCGSKEPRPEHNPPAPRTVDAAAPPLTTWMIDRRGGDLCQVREDDCPPEVTCNPPPPIRFRCPPEAPTTGAFAITSADGRTCHLGATATVVPCPDVAPPVTARPVDAAVAPD